MKRLALLLIPFFFNGCKETPTPNIGGNCVRVSEIAVSSACYDKTKGLRLEAINMPKSAKMLWIIAPLIDTVTTSYRPVYLESDSSSVIIPDSIIASNQKIGIVFAGTEDCVADYYFSFIRRYNPATKCDSWHQKEKFFVGN